MRLWTLVSRLLGAGVIGAALAVVLVFASGQASTAGAASNAQTVTLGSASGTPSQNICLAMINCTYVPFTGVDDPSMQVPFDGTVTSFSVNSASSNDQVELRVLKPAANGQFTGAGTSPAETLENGITTFAVSLPVQAGDLLAIDDSDSALIFDTTTPTAIAAYYELPALADSSTAAPNHDELGYRLLLSAVVVQATVTTTTTTTTTTTPTTTTPALAITALRQARNTWRDGTQSATVARAGIGTVFTFDLNAAATVTVTFTGTTSGRKVGGHCKAATRSNSHDKRCTLAVHPGKLQFNGQSGANAMGFDGIVGHTRFSPGRYTARFSASNSTGNASGSLSFTVVR